MIAGIDAGREQKDESGNCDNLLSDLGHSRLGAATVELGQLDQLVSVERGSFAQRKYWAGHPWLCEGKALAFAKRRTINRSNPPGVRPPPRPDMMRPGIAGMRYT